MRGSKKASTLEKLNRENVISPYLTPQLRIIYDADPYKYLIHLVKAFPDDRYRVIQFMTLKFHPLLLKVCQKYVKKNIDLDWTDLLSFAKYSFVELIYRFDLNSTLYFCVYMPLALDRALNDYHVYNLRRQNLENAIRLEDMQMETKETLIQESYDIQGLSPEDGNAEVMMDSIIEYKQECLQFVELVPDMLPEEKALLVSYLNGNVRLDSYPKDQKTKIRRGMNLLKQHLRGGEEQSV